MEIEITGTDILRAGGIAGDSVNGTSATAHSNINGCTVSGDISADTKGAALCFGGMAGGISAMYAGRQYNVYATGNTSIGNQNSPHKWVGALNGQLTAKAKEGLAEYGYYNEATVQQINGVTQSAIQANGVPGTSLKIGVSSETYAYNQEYMQSKEFATLLNKNIPTVENTLKNNNYTDVKLEKWVVDEEKVVLSGKNYDDVTIHAENFAGGDGTKENPYLIANETQLRNFATSINEDIDYHGVYLALAADISEYTEYAASSYMGTIAAYLYDGVIDNCSATGAISNTAEKGNNFAGGLVGYQYKGAIINSYSDVNVASTTKNGFIAEAGGLVALNNRGLVANCYANGSNITDDYSYYVGTLSGWITGIGKTYRCYYNKDSEMTIGTQKPDPITPVGTIVSSGVNEYGDTYTGGLVLENEGLSATDMKSNVLADKLNGYFKNFPIDISQWGLSDDALNTWTVDEQGNVVTQSKDSAKVTYVQPDIEIVPKVTTAPTSTVPESTQIATSPVVTQEVVTTAPTLQPETTKQPEATKQPEVTKNPEVTKQPNATELPASPSVSVTATPVIPVIPTTAAPGTNNTVTPAPNQDVVVENPNNLPSTGTTSTNALKPKTTYEVKGYGYQLVSAKKATVKVVSVVNKKAKKIVVANTVTINGKKYKVVAIANKAFAGIKTVKTAVIGRNIGQIQCLFHSILLFLNGRLCYN